MPAFVNNGPDIPERLLEAHEDGEVVFFCGAGISFRAGLPDFAGLVAALLDELSKVPNPIQREAIKAKRYDSAIGLIEADTVGHRTMVRETLSRILTPSVLNSEAIATHRALLTLSRTRKGQLRLVTTNFDRLFEHAALAERVSLHAHSAPFLPVPKKRWNGLVYLHGLLPDAGNTTALDQLVVSSGDFGLAYLTERWAARFVSELFRSHTVCFVGYSIDDPVLRYMMDALAADRMRGESPPEMFAFGGYKGRKEARVNLQWRAKNVTPILYRDFEKHRFLHDTLRSWANTYRDGVQGKKMIISQHASAPPLTASRSDFVVGRVLWALTEENAASHFADLNPTPPFKWIEPLSLAQFRYDDLTRYNVTPAKDGKDRNDKLEFSVVERPTPYTHAPPMSLVDSGDRCSSWDPVMWHLARWLVHHLHEPQLVIWLAKKGGKLHPKFARMISHEIDEIEKRSAAGTKTPLAPTPPSTAQLAPWPVMRTLWQLLLSGKVSAPVDDYALYQCAEQIKRDGLTTSSRAKLRELLSPRVSLLERFSLDATADRDLDPNRIDSYVRWEINLASNTPHSPFKDLVSSSNWQLALPTLFWELNTLLREILDLKKDLGGANERSDLSYIFQPSIGSHAQNNDFHAWTLLIELVRDSWLAMAQSSSAQARFAAQLWWETPYPVFKRMALFAAINSEVVEPSSSLDWLVSDRSWWLWTPESTREAIRLVVDLAPKLTRLELEKLEKAILNGPPREMFNVEIEPTEWDRIVDREIWLRLAKMQDAGASLGERAEHKLKELSKRHPHWKLAEDESDEFPVWTSDGDEFRSCVVVPRHRRELVKWLKDYKPPDHWAEDDWAQACRENFPVAACALFELSRENIWPERRWREALQAWSDEGFLKRSWKYVGEVVVKSPVGFFKEIALSLSFWLERQAKTFEGDEGTFFELVRRLLESKQPDNDAETKDSLNHALNHPVGRAIQASLTWWYRQEPEDSDGLPGELLPIFALVCQDRTGRLRPGRVMLAAHAIAIYRVDKNWFEEHMRKSFDWKLSEDEARATWTGFLWSPRLHKPFIASIKRLFLETAKHVEGLDSRIAEQFATFLTYVSLDHDDAFTEAELAMATRSLSPDLLRVAARALVRALDGAGEQRAEYWYHRVVPYIERIWPKDTKCRTPRVANALGDLCIAAGDAFPDAVIKLRHWFRELEHPGGVIHELNKSGLCKRFPTEALELLDSTVPENLQWLGSDLKECLTQILKAAPNLKGDPRFQRLSAICGYDGDA